MGQVAETGAEKYLGKIERADERHQDVLREIRVEALYDTDLADLDRAVLGLIGSPDRLRTYKSLGEKILGNMGKPIIAVSQVREKSRREDQGIIVEQAHGGIIAGDMSVSFGSPLSTRMGEDDSPKIDSATMYVPILPVLAYQHFAGSDPNVYTNETTGNFDRNLGYGRLNVAHIRPNYDKRRNQYGELPVADWIVRDVYIGRNEIYKSELFQKGISYLLNKIEEA